MEKTQDFVIGKDIVLAELEPMNEVLDSLPLQAQFGHKNLMGHVWDKAKEHGVKNLLHSLKERAYENTKTQIVEYTCLDVSHDVIVFGTNVGVIFLYDRTCKRLIRLPCEVTNEPVKCIRLLPAYSYTAVGFNSGLITIFTFVLVSQGFGKPQTMHISGAHNSAVTCLEWSPDGELLYSGDKQGKIYVTVIKIQEGLTQTALILQEPSSVVQLSYSWNALLISTEKRTILWDFRHEKITQVGQKERKSPGCFGAIFYPPSTQEKEKSSPDVYTSRPGLRLWIADVTGKVSATLMYKGLTNDNPPGITIMNPQPVCLSKLPTDFQPQFGPLRLYHGQFFVTWDVSQLWVLDTSPCALVGYHGNLGDIVDVSTVGHEIYVLQRGGERLLIKLSLIPKLRNPLVNVVALLTHSYKSQGDDTLNRRQEKGPQKQLEPINEATTAASVCLETADLPLADASETLNEKDLFKKYQDIRHQDFGEIVFRKQKRSKKKANKDQFTKAVLDLPQEKDESSTGDILPLPCHTDSHVSSDIPDGPDPSIKRLSNISSEFDSGDKCSDTVGEGEATLTIVHVTQEGVEERHVSGDLTSPTFESLPRNGEFHGRSRGSDSETSPAEPECVKLLERTKEMSKTLSLENIVCTDSISHTTSSLVEGHIAPDDSTLGQERSYQSDYLPKIYSDVSVSVSDGTLSDASVEKSHLSKIKFGDTSVSMVSSSRRRGSSDVWTDSEGTPPASLDSDGAEELSDTASWPRSPSRRAGSDLEIVYPEDGHPLEGSSSSPSSGSSLSQSPGSTQTGLRMLADSWADYSPPGQGYLQFLAVSDMHIWCVTNYDLIFYCPTHFSVVAWTQLRGSARMLAVSHAGDVIWSIDRKNYGYVRTGISTNHLTGKKWQPVEKDMRYVAIDRSAVWGIKLNGDVFVRTSVSRDCPTGRGWQTIKVDTQYLQVSCFNGLAWFLDRVGHIDVYKHEGVNMPKSNEKWETVKDVLAKCVCLGIEGVAWIVDMKGLIWFTDVTRDTPTGNTWYQVSLGQYLMQNRSLLESLWSWVLRDDVKLLSVSPKAGVWLLGSGGSIQASHGHLLGTRWDSLAPQGIAQSVSWSYLSVGSFKGDLGHVWALQPNGELMCFQPGKRPVIVEPPHGKILKLISASCNNLWAITHTSRVVQRSGISDTCPQGFGWVELTLNQFGVGKVIHLSCGALSTWAVDNAGNVWLRIGKEDSADHTVTQAWIPVDGSPLSGCRFAKIAISPGDRVVWAVDDRNNVYARRDVTPSFPIGTSWEMVPGTGVRDLAISEHMVWATAPNGDIVCRYGVSKDNCLGYYWKKVPGNFELISVTPDDELWAIDQNGQLFRRKTQHFYGTQSPFKPRTYSALFSGEEDWEFI